MKPIIHNKMLCGIVILVLMVVHPASPKTFIEFAAGEVEQEKSEVKESPPQKKEKAEAGKTAKKEPKERRVIEFDFEKAGLDEAAAGQMKFFLQVPALIRKINVAGKKRRPGKAPRKKIAALLEKAAGLSADEPQEEYLKSLSAAILSDDFSESEKKWLAQSGQKIDIIIRSKKGKKRSRLEVYVLWYRPEVETAAKAGSGHKSKESSKSDSEAEKTSTQKSKFLPNSRIKKYTAILDKLLDNIPINETLAPVNSAAVNPIVVVDVVFAPAVNRFALVYPGYSPAGVSGKFKTFLFRNRLEDYFKKSILPLAVRALTPRWAKTVDFDSFLSNQMMHRLSHYLGPVLIETDDNDVVTVKSKLKDIFYQIEELRADTTAAAGTSVLVEEELITPEQEKSIYSTHLVTLLAALLADPGKEIEGTVVLQVNQLLKKGGVVFDLNSKKLEIEPKLYGTALKRLMLTVAQAEYSGDYERAKIFLSEKSSTPADELTEVLKNLKKKPRRVRKIRKRKKKAAQKASVPVPTETPPEKKENK